MDAPSLEAELRRLVNGFRVSQVLHVVAALGIADLLADGPRSSDELAAAADANPDALYRVLRAAASVGVLHEDDARGFALTPMGQGLRADAPGSIAGWAAHVGRSYFWNAWGNLMHTVRTGENAFENLHGVDAWTYRAEHPEESAIFDTAMRAITRPVNAALLDAYDFGRFRTLADVGGGNGTLLAGLLAAHPKLEGVLLDQPHVVANAHVVLGGAGVADRCRIVPGSFFDDVPSGCDAYVLKSIVHDWDDAESTAILRACRRAIPDDGVLLLVERVVAGPNEGPETKLSDINMLTVLGGRERTVGEFRSLLASAGFELTAATPTSTPFFVLESRPA
jgi:O-methyltransferase domain/Dimerisation domain